MREEERERGREREIERPGNEVENETAYARRPVNRLSLHRHESRSRTLACPFKKRKKTGGTLVGSDVTGGQNPPSNRFATIPLNSSYTCVRFHEKSVCDRHLPTVYINTYKSHRGRHSKCIIPGQRLK